MWHRAPDETYGKVRGQTCALVTGYGSSTINFMDPMVGPVTVRSRVGEPYMHPSSKTFILIPSNFLCLCFA